MPFLFVSNVFYLHSYMCLPLEICFRFKPHKWIGLLCTFSCAVGTPCSRKFTFSKSKQYMKLCLSMWQVSFSMLDSHVVKLPSLQVNLIDLTIFILIIWPWHKTRRNFIGGHRISLLGSPGGIPCPTIKEWMNKGLMPHSSMMTPKDLSSWKAVSMNHRIIEC